VVGRPILYRTSRDFLVHFGLKDVGELPSLKEFEELAKQALGSEWEVREAGLPPEASNPGAEVPASAPDESGASGESGETSAPSPSPASEDGE